MRKYTKIAFIYLLGISSATVAMEPGSSALPSIEKFREEAQKLKLYDFACITKMVHTLDCLHEKGISFLLKSKYSHKNFVETVAIETQRIQPLAETSGLSCNIFMNLQSPVYKAESKEELDVLKANVLQLKTQTASYLKVLIALMVEKGLGEYSLLDLYQVIDALAKSGKDISNIEVVQVEGRTVIRRSVEAN